MNVKIIYYLDVTSSWCYWAEPAWVELKHGFAHQPVEFSWRIALLDESALPASKEQSQWFYRRSGSVMRSPFMLSAGWFEAGQKEYLAANCVPEAAKDFGVTDDRVRLAIATAALREGQKILQWKVSAGVAAKAAGLDAKKLLAKAQSAEIEKRLFFPAWPKPPPWPRRFPRCWRTPRPTHPTPRILEPLRQAVWNH